MKSVFGRVDLPEWAEDRITTHTDIYFDWRDRLRLLVTGKCWVETRTYVEHTPGKVETVGSVNVVPVRWLWRRRMELGMVETPRETTSER